VPNLGANEGPAAPKETRSYPWGLLAKRPLALHDADVASAPGGFRGRGPITEFSMASPRVMHGGAVSEGGQPLAAAPLPTPRGSGGVAAAASARDALPCHFPLELYNLLEARVIYEDEASHDAEDRLNDLGLDLLGAGCGRSVTDAAVQHEWYVRDLVALWRKEATQAGFNMGLSQWALRKLACSDFASITDIASLEMQVRALSR
jgi:hypothetical protein